MSRLAALVLIAALACTPSPSPAPTPAPAPAPAPRSPAPTNPPVIRVDDMRRDLTRFASDEFRGRETGTPEILRAAQFIAERLASLGLEPAGDSGFYARVPMERQGFGPATRIAVSMRGESAPRMVRIGDDVLPLLELSPSLPPPKTRAEADLVFAGYGLSIPALGRNDLAGLDLGGKAVVIVNGAPANASASQRKELESADQVGTRLQEVLSRRPAAVILLLAGASEELYMQLLPGVVRSVSLVHDRAEVPEDARPLPLVLIGRIQTGSPFLPAGWPTDDRPQALSGRRLSAQLDVQRERFTGYNIAAIARGTDAALNRTYVAFGAHYDHIGVLPTVNGDSIANGADDDGSGSIAMLDVARAFRERPSRRSALFVWHVGEEKGLLGSEYFTNHPTVPIDSIVAQINADMIGRNAAELLYVVGPAAAPGGQSRVLGTVLDSVNATLATPFVFNREWDSPTHPERIYERSDHYNYAQKRVPIVFLTSGLHDDYHKVSDDVSRIDFPKLTRVAELIFRTGQAVGNRPTRPR
jgi:hypothetical protein